MGLNGVRWRSMLVIDSLTAFHDFLVPRQRVATVALPFLYIGNGFALPFLAFHHTQEVVDRENVLIKKRGVDAH